MSSHRRSSMNRILVILAACVVVCSRAQIRSSYSCPDTCQLPDCRCASPKAPVSNPPQFIVLTHDDAVHSYSTSTVLNALKNLRNPNGCAIPITWYVSITDTIYYLVKHLYDMNHEIATHTVHHGGLPGIDEIQGARDLIHKNAGIPEEEMRGFRAPYLLHDTQQRQTLYSLGFSYESSINLQANRKQVFPYTLDYGVAIDCSVGTGQCDDRESFPGMWSVPLWTLPQASNSMDPVGDAYVAYMNEFKVKYNGNRAPLGVFFHSGWLNQHSSEVSQFLSEVLATYPDVWVVTNWQMIEWMKNPVSADEYRTRMSQSYACPRKPRGPTPPSEGCLHGTWDVMSYRCICLGEGNPNSNGFCRSSSGTCIVPKSFNGGRFECPESNDGIEESDFSFSSDDDNDSSSTLLTNNPPSYQDAESFTPEAELVVYDVQPDYFCAKFQVTNPGKVSITDVVGMKFRGQLQGKYTIGSVWSGTIKDIYIDGFRNIECTLPEFIKELYPESSNDYCGFCAQGNYVV